MQDVIQFKERLDAYITARSRTDAVAGVSVAVALPWRVDLGRIHVRHRGFALEVLPPDNVLRGSFYRYRIDEVVALDSHGNERTFAIETEAKFAAYSDAERRHAEAQAIVSDILNSARITPPVGLPSIQPVAADIFDDRATEPVQTPITRSPRRLIGV